MNIYTPEFAEVLAEVSLQASQDAEFKARLLQDGAGILQERGVSLADDFKVIFTESASGPGLTISLSVIQPLSDEALEGVVAASTAYSLHVTNNSNSFPQPDIYQPPP